MNAESIIAYAKATLRRSGSAKRAQENKAYFKSPLDFVGVSKKDINEIGQRVVSQMMATSRRTMLRVLRTLWQSHFHEDRTLAIVLAASFVGAGVNVGCMDVFDIWIEECWTWDHIDEISIRIIGVLALEEPRLWKRIEKWALHGHMWKRRASLISHLPSIRRGNVQTQVLRRTCLKLASDKDFFIRKAIGWVLRELADQDKSRAVRLVQEIAPQLSRLSLREATRKLGARLSYQARNCA